MKIYFFLFILYFILFHYSTCEYKPDWSSIDSRPIPEWYNNAKLGIFAHWGVYSVPAYHSEWFWYYWKTEKQPAFQEFVLKYYRNDTTYADFAKDFTAEDFDSDKFADVIKASGAKYFVLTSKHHEGFTMWPSSTSWNWNSVDVGPHRDLVGELSASICKLNLHFGVYFSLMDWFHPLYINDKLHNTSDFVSTVSEKQLHELVENYKPDIIWSDGDWDRTDTYWKSKEFLVWLYNKSPVKENIVVNDRWGNGTVGNHGGFLTHSDEFDPGTLLARKWENCLKLDQYSWGFRRNIKFLDVLTLKTLILKLARTISCGGNLLINIGPDRTGRIIPIFEERLRQFGNFVNTNDEAIFGTLPWIYQNESNTIWYTSRLREEDNKFKFSTIFNKQNKKNTIIYAFVLEIPENWIISLPSVKVTSEIKVSLLGTTYYFTPQNITKNASLSIKLNDISWQKWPSRDALVLKIEYAASEKRNPLLTN